MLSCEDIEHLCNDCDETIRKCFSKNAKKHHPDKNGDAEKFVQLQNVKSKYEKMNVSPDTRCLDLRSKCSTPKPAPKYFEVLEEMYMIKDELDSLNASRLTSHDAADLQTICNTCDHFNNFEKRRELHEYVNQSGVPRNRAILKMLDRCDFYKTVLEEYRKYRMATAIQFIEDINQDKYFDSRTMREKCQLIDHDVEKYVQENGNNHDFKVFKKVQSRCKKV